MSNDNKVLQFKLVTPEVTPSDHNTPNPVIVKMFEDFLEKAKAGEIVFGAIAVVSSDMVAYSTWEPEGLTPQIITAGLGAVSYLSHRFGRACDEGADYSFSNDPAPGSSA